MLFEKRRCLTPVHDGSAALQERLKVFEELRSVSMKTKLLYTTPEQLQASAGLTECLQRLHQRCARLSPPVLLLH